MDSAPDDAKARRRAEREARLQAALRDNLRRRKAQARQRTESEPADSAIRPSLSPDSIATNDSE